MAKRKQKRKTDWFDWYQWFWISVTVIGLSWFAVANDIAIMSTRIDEYGRAQTCAGIFCWGDSDQWSEWFAAIGGN